MLFFTRQNKLLVTPSKTRGRPPGSKCPYDLSRTDVEWLTALNKSRQNKGLMELEESVLEKALSYIENKVTFLTSILLLYIRACKWISSLLPFLYYLNYCNFWYLFYQLNKDKLGLIMVFVFGFFIDLAYRPFS